jgi:aspartate 1-decarboxylase
MQLTLLKSKIHRATVTDANLNYEGSITVCPKLCDAAHIRPFEKVDIYNCNNGQRFSTYVILGKEGDMCLNGAAARLVQPGDLIILACFVQMSEEEAAAHKPRLVFVDSKNAVAHIT